MRCPFCNFEESKVTDSRTASEINSVKRRRECLRCMNRFTTFETIDLSLQVKKRDGTYEDFQQEKLLKGLEAACKRSKISHDQVRFLVSQITADLMGRQVREVSSQELGEIVMQHLLELDAIAYIRFACVYKRFQDIKDLMGAVDSITPKDSNNKKEDTLHGTF